MAATLSLQPENHQKAQALMHTAALFTGESISNYLADHKASLIREVSRIDSVEKLRDKAPALRDQASVSMVELHRSEAEFMSTESDKGVVMSLAIPFQGDERLFRVGVAGAPPIKATIRDKHWLDDENPPTITIEKAFEFPKPEEVRAWGKELVDGIEATLARIGEPIEEHNAKMRVEVERLIEERRAILVNIVELRENLSKGI